MVHVHVLDFSWSVILLILKFKHDLLYSLRQSLGVYYITLPICLQTLSNLRIYTFVISAHTIIFITVTVNQHLKQYELHILEVYFAVKTCFL